jgi:hypothetical protein
MNRAAGIRAAVLAAHPEAIVVERRAASIRHRIADAPDGRQRYVLDAVIGDLHYPDALGQLQEIDTALADDGADGFLVRTGEVGYLLRAGDNGKRRFYPNKYDLTRYVEFGFPLALKNATRSESGLKWTLAHVDVEVIAAPTRAKLLITLKDAQAPTSISFPVSLTGLTRSDRVLLTDGVPVAWLVFPAAVDAEGTERDLQVSYAAGKVTVALNTAGLVYPILIDPTVDKQTAASANDGGVDDSSGGTKFSSGDTGWYVGCYAAPYSNEAMFARWTGVTIEGTIDVSYISLYPDAAAIGTPQWKIYGVDEDNPAAPTSHAEFDADALTTAGVDWDGGLATGAFRASPSLISIFQELVASYTISNEAVMVQVKNDKALDGEHDQLIRMWDYAGNAHGPKLHIEYTAAGAGYAHSQGYVL